jgi:hypothetical protein
MSETMTPASLPNSPSIADINDASLFHWPKSANWQTTSYSRILARDSVYVKAASSHGFTEYKKYVVHETRDSDAIRRNETVEKLANLSQLVGKYPAFEQFADQFGELQTHWLLIHRLQYDRLKENTSIALPDICFVFLSKPRLFRSPAIHPASVQSRISGICLFDMIDHTIVLENRRTRSFVKDDYKPLLPSIKPQLAGLADSPMSDHINWFIKNFVFETDTDTLFYVDTKPSNIFGKWRNDQNLENIRRDFLQ